MKQYIMERLWFKDHNTIMEQLWIKDHETI